MIDRESLRSVVASHGPGSNPRGNAICNAILLQSFSVLQIFGLQYLDRHRPPSLDVLPLNLAQKLKISKSTKTGPDIAYRPENFTGCPEQARTNPRKKSAVTTSPELRRRGGRWRRPLPRKTRGGSCATSRQAQRNVARRPVVAPASNATVRKAARNYRPCRPIKRRTVWPVSMRRNSLREGGSSATQASAQQFCWTRPACGQRARIAAPCAACTRALLSALAVARRSPPVRDQRASRTRSCARYGGAPPHVAAADGHA
ncbi:villin-4-like [Dorcoceras hygrometricum]|uniref:Villin-4-like n=1 Tax=Dorcoceras hygrometricum TaxID=472368 RepID=A0A2Z7AFH1_9LAMI|nr:villin-4-like [Dorcoceras hygrometricum]